MPRMIAKILCSFFLLTSVTVFAKPTATEIKSVDSFMKAFIQAYEKRDLNTLMQFYAPNAVVIGTGKDEILQGREQIKSSFKRDLDQSNNATISMTPIAVTIQNNIAFASYHLMVDVKLPNNKSFQSPLRFSVGLVKHDKSWLLVQTHLSAPLAGQDEGQAFPKSP